MRSLIILILLGLSFVSRSQSIVLSGTVRDSATQESLIGAYVYSQASSLQTSTDASGRFQLLLPTADSIDLVVTYVGYSPLSVRIYLGRDTVLGLSLTPSNTFSTVEVTTERNYVIPKTEGSATRLSAETIQKLPKLLGEADPIRALQVLPGVQNGAEGSSALYVRGGSPDQNLILVDDIPIYSPNHLGGFFSIIDAEAINAVTLYKGGFPARFSGRLSSIVDIRLKDGNPQKWSRTFSLGVLSTKLAVSGPLVKNKLTLAATARRTNLDLFTQARRLFASDNAFRAGFYFYDGIVKLNYTVNPKSQITLSSYLGNDKLYVDQTASEQFDEKTVEQTSSFAKTWGNRAVGLRWDRTLSPRLQTTYALAYTTYNYLDRYTSLLEFEDEVQPSKQTDNNLSSNVRDVSIRLHHQVSGRHLYRFGLTANLPTYNQPRIVLDQSEGGAVPLTKDTGKRLLRSYQTGGYVEWEPLGLNPWTLNLGWYTGLYGVNGSVFPTLQPRVSVSYAANDRYTVFAHYAEMVQPLHLLSNAGGGPPTDLWLPATARIPPGRSRQTSLGMRYNYRRWLIEVEGYLKSLSNQIEFQNGASFFVGSGDWQDKVSSNGTGRVIGLELFVKYKVSDFQFWSSYTLSRNQRKFSDINNGNVFPYRYDRPHMLNLVALWEPTKKFNASLNWTLESGNAITLPSARYEVEVLDQAPSGNPFNAPPVFFGPHSAYIYRSRNNARMPTYHRLDVNFDFIREVNKKGKVRTRTTSLGVYNGYSRKNPYFVFYDATDGGQQELRSLALFPVIPYITYKTTY